MLNGGGGTERDAAESKRRLPRVIDLLLCAVTATGLLAAVVFLGTYTHVGSRTFGKWLGFGAATVIVFGDNVRLGRREWAQSEFWVSLLGCLVGQIALGSVVLQRIPSVPVMVWAVFLPADYILVGALMAFFQRRGSDPPAEG